MLLVYNICTGEYIVMFTYVLTTYLSYVYPLHQSLSSPNPLLRTISAGFILLFSHMNTKCIHRKPLIDPFLMPTPFHWHPLLKKDQFYTRLSISKKYILIVQGDFAMVLQGCISHVLIKLTPPLLILFRSPCSPNIQQFTL
jgi:hypothetical protein